MTVTPRRGTPPLPIAVRGTPPLPRDQLQRPLRDLRVSVTDRCNFRCRYCMPREAFGPAFRFVDRADLLTFEEIARIVGIFARLGVGKVRITGGEPLLRRDIERLVGMIVGTEGIADVAMTTNGTLLPHKAHALREAGLGRVTVSLDSLDDAAFRAMSDVNLPVAVVLDGIASAQEAGFDPIKINSVVKRGVNDSGILELARFGRERGHIIRFIEYMDVGTTNGWRLDDVVPAEEIVARINALHPLEPAPPTVSGEVASRYRYRDGGGEIGVIASVTRPFCQACSRARLSPLGELYTCLFAASGQDLRTLVRRGAGDDELEAIIRGVWRARDDRYSELRTAAGTSRPPKVEMSYIGG
ncbi:MAG: GTP 3',8-cyclase MoaA [Nitriliruptorales bacterium]